MPSIKTYNINTSEFEIKNKVVHSTEHILQVIGILLTTDSPLRLQKTSISSLVGKSNVGAEDVKNGIVERMNRIQTIMKDEYAVQELQIKSVETDGKKYKITLQIVFANGSTNIGELYV